jgi:hypothetical protein
MSGIPVQLNGIEDSMHHKKTTACITTLTLLTRINCALGFENWANLRDLLVKR